MSQISTADVRDRSSGDSRPSRRLARPQSDAAEARRRHSKLSMHVGFLLISVGVIVAAALLRITESGHVGLPWGGDSTGMPALCFFRRMFGIDCPGCGLTRCFVSVAHGDIAGAWRFHPVGIFFFAIVVAQLPYRSMQIMRLMRGREEISTMSWAPWLAATLGVLLIGQWIVRMVI